jgi:hypothetical protein
MHAEMAINTGIGNEHSLFFADDTCRVGEFEPGGAFVAEVDVDSLNDKVENGRPSRVFGTMIDRLK